MDGIDAIRQSAERTAASGAADSFKTAADGFAALLQLTGKGLTGDDALNAAEKELMRLDDGRDLVRDSHTLNDADARRDDAEDLNEVEDPDADKEPELADDDGDNQDNDTETADSSDEESDAGNGENTENQNASGENGENANQPAVAGEGTGAELGLVEGAAATGAGQQVNTATAQADAQVNTEKTVQVAASVDTSANQTGVQTQQSAQAEGPQVNTVQSEQADRAFAPVQTQAAQTSTTAAQAQTAATQQANTQTAQAQTQQGPEVRQDRAAAQTTEVRSAAAQSQAQDLSQRLGDDTRARVQVNINGQQAGQGPTEPGQFNRFVGYNGADGRTVSTANGQAGTGTASNAATAAPTDTPAERPATQATAPIPTPASQPHTQASQPGALSNAPVSRVETGSALPRGGEGLTQSNSGQSGATNTAAPQPTVQAAPTQTGQSFAQQVQQPAGTERPPAPTSGQVIEQIKVNINKSVKAGLDRVTIQLRPENLGRIEVKMELSQDGKVRALVTADVKDTLDLLQRDARGLERALQDAGLRTDSNNLQFALRSETQGQGGENQKGQFGQADNDNADAEADELLAEEEEFNRQKAAAARGGVDQTV